MLNAVSGGGGTRGTHSAESDDDGIGVTVTLSVLGPPGYEGGVSVVKTVIGFLLVIMTVVGAFGAQPLAVLVTPGKYKLVLDASNVEDNGSSTGVAVDE